MSKQKLIGPNDIALIGESSRIRTWEVITSDPMAVVLADGYFDPVAGNVDVLDRLDITAGYKTGSIETVLLIVVGIRVKERESRRPGQEISRFEQKVRRVRLSDYAPAGAMDLEEARRLIISVGVIVAPFGAPAAMDSVEAAA